MILIKNKFINVIIHSFLCCIGLMLYSCDNSVNIPSIEPLDLVEDSSLVNTNDSVVLIQINEKIKIRWDNNVHTIIMDELFLKITSNYESYEKKLLESILDTHQTNALYCNNTSLLKGDVAFFILDKIRMIPYFTIFQSQLDVFNDCLYLDSLLFVLRVNRLSIEDRLESFFSKHTLSLEERKEKMDGISF